MVFDSVTNSSISCVVEKVGKIFRLINRFVADGMLLVNQLFRRLALATLEQKQSQNEPLRIFAYCHSVFASLYFIIAPNLPKNIYAILYTKKNI